MPLHGEYLPGTAAWARKQAERYESSGGAEAADLRGRPIIVLTTVGRRRARCARPAPGTAQGLQIVVTDVAAARAELVGRGVDASEVQDFPWGKFVFFSDPDGNGWALQEMNAPA